MGKTALPQMPEALRSFLDRLNHGGLAQGIAPAFTARPERRRVFEPSSKQRKRRPAP
jgi:hypothetical protein